MRQTVNHGVMLGIAVIAAALALSALFMNWESGPIPRNTAQSDIALKQGRAATTTDPAQKTPDHELPKSLLD